jgi:hypothetical protein
MPQLKNGWKSTEADEMGQWKAFWNVLGFTQKVKAKVDFFFECGGRRIGVEACRHRLDV